MTTIQLHFRAKMLANNTDVKILLPDAPDADIPVLYLLHGMYGDYTSWTEGSAIGKYAREKGIAVVMPSAQNSFYCNMRYGPRYYDYVTRELPAFLEKTLPQLSVKREKTFIAGLSMGGYGAIKLALRNPERYAACASLSGSLDIGSRMQEHRLRWGREATAIWGEDYEHVFPGSADDVIHLVKTFPEDKPKPRIFFACGTEDALYGENQSFRKAIEGRGFDVTYDDGPGGHDWIFWDAWILPAIECMMRE